MKLKIVLTRSMVPEDIRYIKQELDKKIAGGYEFAIPSEFTEEGILRESADADVLLGPYVTKGILENAKRLKLIQVPWTGMDTFRFDAVKGYDIPVCNTHSNADAVAEMGMALTLDLLKKVSYHDRKMRDGNWNREQKPLDLKSRMLSAQTVCILGYGSIGSRIGKMVRAFGATVVAVGGKVQEGEILSAVYSKDRMEEALKAADVVICTVPLTDATKGMLDAKRLGILRESAILINLSRAAVVDEDALWDALTSGKLGGFGADVWWNAPKRGESESYPSEKHEFWKLENVVMSPHRAGFVENCLPHLDGAIANIIALAEGKSLQDIVDTERGY